MRAALARHDAILRAAIADADGDVVKTTGDGLMAVFSGAGRAPRPRRSPRSAPCSPSRGPTPCPLRVRMGIHTGEAEPRGGDYFGPAVNRAARIMAAGHGGQVLLSASTAALARRAACRDGARSATSASTG